MQNLVKPTDEQKASAEASVSINPIIQRDKDGNVYPSKCTLSVEVIPTREEPSGFKLKTLSIFTPKC